MLALVPGARVQSRGDWRKRGCSSNKLNKGCIMFFWYAGIRMNENKWGNKADHHFFSVKYPWGRSSVWPLGVGMGVCKTCFLAIFGSYINRVHFQKKYKSPSPIVYKTKHITAILTVNKLWENNFLFLKSCTFSIPSQVLIVFNCSTVIDFTVLVARLYLKEGIGSLQYLRFIEFRIKINWMHIWEVCVVGKVFR